jgi:hypothetical protein
MFKHIKHYFNLTANHNSHAEKLIKVQDGNQTNIYITEN